jgi:putative effector of murein hydrolase
LLTLFITGVGYMLTVWIMQRAKCAFCKPVLTPP